jgi:hypothetical protein
VKPPRKIKVGPFTYRIERGTVRDDEQGNTLFERQRIAIRPGLAPGLEAEVVTHECLHTLTELTGQAARLGPKREEELVRALAPALLALLRENPRLVEYLTV